MHLLIGLFLLALSFQDSAYVPITPENVGDLTVVGEYGNGLLTDVIQRGDDLIAVTTRAVFVYPGGDLNAEPQTILYEQPALIDDRFSVFIRNQGQLLADGELLVVNGRNGTISIDLVTGEQVGVSGDGPFEANEDVITLATDDGTLEIPARVRDVAPVRLVTDGESRELFSLERTLVFDAAASNDTLYLATQNGVQAYDLEGGELRFDVSPDERIDRITLVPDGLLAASEGQTFVYNLNSGELVNSFEQAALTLLGESNELLVLEETESRIGDDLVFLDAETSEETRRIVDGVCWPGSGTLDVFLSADGSTLTTAVYPGTAVIRSWDVTADSPVELGAVGGFRLGATDMVFSADSSTLYVAQFEQRPVCGDNQPGAGVLGYDVFTGEVVERIPAPERVLYSVDVADDGTLIVGESDGPARYEIGAAVARQEDVERYPIFINEAAISPNGAFAATAFGSEVVVYDREMNIIAEYDDGVEAFWGENLILTDDVLIYATQSGVVAVRDPESGVLLQEIPYAGGFLNALDYDPLSNRLAVITWTRERDTQAVFTVYDLESGEALTAIEVSPNLPVMRLFPGGELFALSNPGGDIAFDTLGGSIFNIHSVETGERVLGTNAPWTQVTLAVSPDGRFIATSGGSGSVVIFGVPG